MILLIWIKFNRKPTPVSKTTKLFRIYKNKMIKEPTNKKCAQLLRFA